MSNCNGCVLFDRGREDCLGNQECLEDQGIRFKCKICDGAGQVPNTMFEICRKPEVREKAGIKEGGCDICIDMIKTHCKLGEYDTCGNCEGSGFLVLSSEEWVYFDGPIKRDPGVGINGRN